MVRSKTDSKTPEDIKDYLAAAKNLPTRLFQYTSYQALVSILQNRSFRISRTDLLNDKAEIKLGVAEEHKRSYLMSFTEESEYVSMWTMYGKSIGVKLRLDFERKLLESLLKATNIWFVDSDGRKITIEDKSKPLFEIATKRKPIRLSRVAYYNTETNTICEAGGKDNFSVSVDDVLIDELTGFIKYSAWESERETRLRITLNPEVIVNNNIEYLYIGLDDEIIGNFHITFNPCIPKTMKNEIEKSLNKLAGVSLNYSDSKLEGQIDESILYS